jgi:adenine-specific DNA-methyltransferase
MVMNEIFGEENFVGQFIWKSRQNKDNRNVTGASIDHEYILCYGKRLRGSERKTDQYKNPDNDQRGPWTSGNMVGLLPEDQRPNCHYDLVNPETGINYGKPKLGWRYDKNTMARLIQEKRIIWPDTPEGRPRKKVFLEELNDKYTGYSSIVGKNIYTRNGTAEVEEIFGFRAFDFPKPSALIKELLSQGLEDGDIILDFFGGSAPTAQAVMELNKEDNGNRKFILVQMPEQCDENSEAYKAGYKTIADIAKERIRRVIQKIEKEKAEKPDLFESGKLDLGFKVFKLSPSNFKIWRGSEIDSEEKLVQQLNAFTNPIRPGAEKQNMLYELILKAGYELTSPVQYVIASEAKQSQGKKGSTNPCNDSIGYYSINNNELIIALDAMNDKLIKQIIAAKPQKVITLDSLFTGNDQLKTNTVLQMRDAGIDFKTI